MIAALLLACTAPEPSQAPTAVAARPAPVPAVPEATLQVVDGDLVVPHGAGSITIHPVHHGTVRLTIDGTTIWVDPWAPDEAAKERLDGPKADVLLITDLHPDHLDPAAIDLVATDATRIIAPAAVDAKLERPVAHVLANGESIEIGAIELLATPMYNLERGPEPGKLFHTKGRGNGYLLTVGERRLLIAGDTACTPELRAMTGLDVVLIPMNLPYTMPPEEAATCVKAMAPAHAVPYHHRGSDLDVFAKGLEGTDVQIHRLAFYP